MTSSTTIAEITRLDLQALQTPPAAFITNVKHPASYNWIEASQPTIAIPGSPALWSALAGPQQLKKDSDFIYIAQNAARHPDSPLEPLFCALYVEHPAFDIRSVDLVTDRNNIRKLLSFVNPGSSRNGLEPFTIHVEVNKKTAIFSRKETATAEFIGPNDFKGYGHAFEKAYTTNQGTGSTGHHRIISYRFGDLNCIVRYETDGYVADTRSLHSHGGKTAESDGLSSMLASLSLSPTNGLLTHTTTPAPSKLTIKTEGQAVPLESTIEIKTRVAHKPLAIQDVAPQLWISQTPKLVRAYHNRGTFQDPEVEDVAADIKKGEEANQADLRKLAALINRILNVLRGKGGHAMVKYERGKEDKLVVYNVDGGIMLPRDWFEMGR